MQKRISKKKILPWYRQTKSTHKERLEKKENAHRNKLAKSGLTLRNSVMNASKVMIAAKASNSTSIANSSNSAISASASSTVNSVVSQGETSEEPCTATVQPQGPKRKLKQVDLSSFFKKQKL